MVKSMKSKDFIITDEYSNKGKIILFSNHLFLLTSRDGASNSYKPPMFVNTFISKRINLAVKNKAFDELTATSRN